MTKGESMGKRYVYWRTPEGKPCKRDDHAPAPRATLATLGSLASIQSGTINWTFPNFPHDHYLVLRSATMVITPDRIELNEADSTSIINEAVRSAILEAGGGTPIPPEVFVSHANRLAAEFFRKPLNDLLCVSTLSVGSLPADPVEIWDCKVSELAKHQVDFLYPKSLEDYTTGERFDKHFRETQYQRVVVETKGRTPCEVQDKASNALSLLRGLWMLYERHGRRTMHFGLHPYKPLGSIHTGPLHTVHKPDGTLAIDTYWYEPDYFCDHPLFVPDKGWGELEKFRCWALSEMEKHKYKQELYQLLVRLASAYSQIDPNTAFLQLWCILERITDTVGKRYEDTIERTAWFYVNASLVKEQLEHLRYRRNQYVHSSKSDAEMDQIVVMAKGFIEEHLLRLIRNDFNVESFEEYGRFLSLPTNVDILKRRREHLDRAIEIREKKEPSK